MPSCGTAERWGQGCRRGQNCAVGRTLFSGDVLSSSEQGSLPFLATYPSRNGEMLAIAWPSPGDSCDLPMRKHNRKFSVKRRLG